MFNWGWYTGMLRSSEEYDLLMSLDYQGKGTMQVGGQPCNVTMYRSDISYQTSGERIRITGTRPNGQSCNTIEVLSGAYAWNEDIQGAELVPGKGKATPMPATVEERMIRLWSGPQGAFKAAFAGTSPDAPPMTPRPQRLAADVMTIGKTSVAWVGNKPVLTYPIPGVPTATATTTLDAKFMPESVVVKNGATTYEFTYSDYKDWNNPLNPAEALYAGRMTEKRNGTVVRDITTTLTETGQMYVVMPVPASIKAAIKPTHQPPNWTLPAAPAIPQTAAVVTPRLANGKPDLTGVWGGAFNPITGGGARRCGPTQKDCKVAQDNFWVDYEWISPSRFGVYGRPIYKPEFWDKVQELDQWTNKEDPIMTCQPMGLPRSLTPRRIFQTVNDITHVVYDERLRRRKPGISRDSDRRPQARSEEDRGHLLRIHRGALGGRHAGARLHLISSIRRGWDEAASSTPATCASSRSSRGLAMKSATTSPSRIPSHSSSPG